MNLIVRMRASLFGYCCRTSAKLGPVNETEFFKKCKHNWKNIITFDLETSGACTIKLFVVVIDGYS